MAKVDGVLADVETLAARVVWPGFDVGAVPIAIYDGNDTILVHHPNPPASFRSLPNHPGLVRSRGMHDAVRSNTCTPINGTLTATVRLDCTDRSSLSALAALVIHECFHVYQRLHHPDWQANEVDLFVYPLDDPAILAARHLEASALRRALALLDSADSRSWIRAALRERHARYERLPAEAIAWERGTELNEGLAQYVEYQALGHRGSPEPIPEMGLPVEAVRLERYGTGEALALLLDRTLPDWKDHLQAGETHTLDELLDAAVGRGDGSPEMDPGRDAILAAARTEVEQLAVRRAAQRDAFLGADGWQIEVRVRDGSALWPQAFDPLNVQRVSASEVLHSRFLQLGNDRATIEVLDRPVLTEAAGDHPLFKGVRRLTITGIKERPVLEQEGQRTVIKAPGIVIELVDAGAEERGRTIVVPL